MAKIIVSARAVEMLGRQQIAGVSTALSELLKNAHDAYASDVSVEAYSSKSTLIIRDNGRGMSPDDFQKRWLTLGTDSKAEGSTLPLLAKPDERPERAIVGEKGIGRLALALLGRHLLVVTRAQKSKTELDKIVVAYIPWDIFDVPGLTLSEIDIPVVELDAELPDERIFTQLRESFLKQFDRFEAKGAASGLLQAIRVEAEKIEFDVRRTAPKLRDAATFDLRKSTGTHFYVFESNPTINEEFDELKEFRVKQSEPDVPAPDIYKSLIGFSNKDDSDANGDRFDVQIARVDGKGVREPLFDEGEFFTEEFFRQVDHTFQGDFDKTGRFTGCVAVFGKEHKYELAPPNDVTNPTCGAFKIRFGYLQGKSADSKLDKAAHTELVKKLNAIGGLYIYRNGIRVLPYGNSDYDFLDVERNRTKSAEYYFFSYRRMFGTIDITRAENGELKEKAGREGFQTNRAYRDFRKILKNFLIMLAKDFFRKGAQFQEFNTVRQENAARREEVRKERENFRRQEQEKLARQIDAVFSDAVRDELREQVEQIAKEFETYCLTSSESLFPKSKEDYEREAAQARGRLKEAREQFQIKNVLPFGVTREMERDAELARREMRKIDAEIFAQATLRVETCLRDALKKCEEAKKKVDVFQLSYERLNAAAQKLRDDWRREKQREEETNQAMQARIRNWTNELDREFGERLTQLLEKFKADNERVRNEAKLLEAQTQILLDFDKLKEECLARLEILIDVESDVLATKDDSGKNSGFDNVSQYWETLVALEDQVEVLQSEIDDKAELALIGSALGIIHHEFILSYLSMQDSIKELQRWSKTNPSLKDLYGRLKNSFDYFSLFMKQIDPLLRRKNRVKTEVTGESVRRFLADALEKRLISEQITFRITPGFKKWKICVFQAELLPVFLNLVDNSIYWLKGRNEEEKIIELDCDAQGRIRLADNGVGVEERDVEAIFDKGFTRKPGGRGFGLYLARTTLAKMGYDIWALSKNESKYGGAEFVISPLENEESSDE